MPTKSDIINAVNNLNLFLKIPDLEGVSVEKKTNGSPLFYTGGYNMVFKLNKGSKKWAFRVWHINLKNLKERFQKISLYITEQKLPFFADFIYDENGILVNGEFIDTIRMEWTEGSLLKDYIEKHLHNKQVLIQLAESFYKMCKILHEHQISHGDLQQGNIIIDKNNNIRLIDYDSICVPSIEGENELVTGLKGFQHPSRLKYAHIASLKADYFSELIIYLSIIAIAYNPSLWETYNIKESDVLLFENDDFEDIKKSSIYKDLSNHNIQEINNLLDILTEYLNEPSYLDLKPIETYLDPPIIIKFSVDKAFVITGQKATLFWDIENACEVTIDNGIGRVTNKGEMTIFPNQNTIYKIIAKGYKEEIYGETSISIFPTPIIKSILLPIPEFESRINLDYSIFIDKPKLDISIKTPHFNFTIPSRLIQKIELRTISPFYENKLSKFSLSKILKSINKYVRNRSNKSEN